MQAQQATLGTSPTGERELADEPRVSRSVVHRLHLRAAKALFLLAASASLLFSVYLWFLVDQDQGVFVGLWVPSILSLGALLLAGKGGSR